MYQNPLTVNLSLRLPKARYACTLHTLHSDRDRGANMPSYYVICSHLAVDHSFWFGHLGLGAAPWSKGQIRTDQGTAHRYNTGSYLYCSLTGLGTELRLSISFLFITQSPGQKANFSLLTGYNMVESTMPDILLCGLPCVRELAVAACLCLPAYVPALSFCNQLTWAVE